MHQIIRRLALLPGSRMGGWVGSPARRVWSLHKCGHLRSIGKNERFGGCQHKNHPFKPSAPRLANILTVQMLSTLFTALFNYVLHLHAVLLVRVHLICICSVCIHSTRVSLVYVHLLSYTTRAFTFCSVCYAFPAQCRTLLYCYAVHCYVLHYTVNVDGLQRG